MLSEEAVGEFYSDLFALGPREFLNSLNSAIRYLETVANENHPSGLLIGNAKNGLKTLMRDFCYSPEAERTMNDYIDDTLDPKSALRAMQEHRRNHIETCSGYGIVLEDTETSSSKT